MTKSPRIETLTSLRFFAAAIIAVGHAGFWPGLEKFKFEWFNVGNAVSFFFVLSGFVLSYTYNAINISNGYRNYIAARIARIWPIHIVMLLAYIFIINPYLFQYGNQTQWQAFIVNALLLQSWVPYSDFFYSYNGVSWSISTEFAFYISFPFLIVTLKKNYRILLFFIPTILFIAFTICYVFNLPRSPSPEHISAAFFLYINPITRLVEFIAGMMTWLIFKKYKVEKLSKTHATILEIGAVLALLFGMVICQWIWVKHGEYFKGSILSWVAVSASFPLMAFVIYIYSHEKGYISQLLLLKPLIYLGEISFALYMFHQMILRYFDVYHKALLTSHPTLIYIIYWIVALSGSAFLYSYVEKPCRFYIKKLITI